MKISQLVVFSFLKIWLTACGATAVLVSISAHAQTDTVIVRGKVDNLTLRLYRQAPEITVARVNILQPEREIVRAATLQPNGQFELKMPLIYPLEECYLNYANVSLPFLAAKGTVEITLFADSLGKTEVPLRFGGLYAATNNRHARFYTAYNQWLKANPEKSTKAENSYRFWEKISLEQEQRIGFYRSFSSAKDPVLDKWVISSLEEATNARFYHYLIQQKEVIPTGLIGAADLDTTLFLTFAKADCYRQFSAHAVATTPAPAESTLPINKLATLILKYVPNLPEEDIVKLQSFAQGEKAKMSDLKWLNNLYLKKQDTLNLISTYELYVKKFGASYMGKELEYLKPQFYLVNLNNYPGEKMTQWYRYIRSDLQNPYYIRSLDEIHRRESADSALIQAAQSQIEGTDVTTPAEIKGGLLLAQNTLLTTARTVWEQIKKKYQGKNIYLIFWTNDDIGRAALEEARALRERLPENKIAFVYLCEHKTTDELWIQSVVKSKAKGLHLKLNEIQNDDFVIEWEINSVPHCVLLDPNGKYIQRKAPLPADQVGWDKVWNKLFR
ncbi:MAG: hypothetical protein U0X91_24130 [Spirosomataceae bacterium]